MSMMQAVKAAFHNYAVFQGRARRSEFWYFVLFNTLIHLVLSVFTAIFPPFSILMLAYWVISLVPGIAVCWRRLHDTGRCGALYFISFVPIVGAILLIIWLSEDGVPGSNPYGPNPKGVGSPDGRRFASTDADAGLGCLAVQCLSGPLQGQTYRVGSAGVQFGREAGCGIRMPDRTPGVSRRHCCIRWQQGIPVLVDVGSSFGTFLASGKQLPPNYPEPVSAGTRFYLGNKKNLFQLIVL